MEFKASMSNTVKAMTTLMLIIIVVALIPTVLFLNGYPTLKLGIELLLLVTLLISWGFSTRGYTILGSQLCIKRPFGDRTFDLRDVRKSEKVTAKDLRFSLRTFGNGGLFGYYGKFLNRKFGHMTWYATNLNNAVLLKLKDGSKVLVTPDEAERFLSETKLYQAY